jgi:hypothetical protein
LREDFGLSLSFRARPFARGICFSMFDDRNRARL